jgi:hypothetical protein
VTLALVLIATVAVFAAVGLAHAAYPPHLASIVLSWQGALALGLTLAWSLVDLVVRRRQRPPFADNATAKRALKVRALSAGVTFVVVGVDLGLLVMAGMGIKTALLVAGAFVIILIGLLITGILIASLRRRCRAAGSS